MRTPQEKRLEEFIAKADAVLERARADFPKRLHGPNEKFVDHDRGA